MKVHMKIFPCSKLSKSIKFACYMGTAVTLLSPMASAADAVTEEVDNVERIQVTGSRLSSTNLSQPTPITTIDADEIAKFGTQDLASILSELPAVGATDTLVGNNNSNAGAGLSSADLRRLGSNRTLVLVNGKRHVAGAEGSAQVDLGTIPANMIKRVEIITGGASAIYGSDAVSGVVNVILKDDFEGLEFNVAGSTSTEGVGAENTSVNILAGTSTSDGKGNITFFAGVDRFSETLNTDIRQFSNFGNINNPLNGSEDDSENNGIADRLTVPNILSERIDENGVLNPFGGRGTLWAFKDDGTPVIQTDRTTLNTGSFAFGDFPNGCDTCFHSENYENYQPSLKKVYVGSSVNYDINKNITFYSDFKYVNSDILQQFQPSFRFGNVSINVAENAFLDEGLRQTFLDDGTSNVALAKFFDELGPRTADNKRSTFRFVGGFKGDFTLSETSFEYDLFYVEGQTTNRRKTLNSLIVGNLSAALDSVIDPSTGNAVCRNQLESAQGEAYSDPATVNGDQCVAYNPFGFNQASDAAKDFVAADVTREDKITQKVFGGSIVSDTSEFFELQGGAIEFAAGFEYREESSEGTTDEFTKSGFLANAATPDSFGEYDVTEFFAELKLPLLEGKFLAEELTLDAAFRTADYSHAGRADAWKVGLIYSPIEELRIRSTYGFAVRAPNITEAFSPVSPGFANISDPCDTSRTGNDPDRAANCAAQGIASSFVANDNVSIDLLSGGNDQLVSEESTSLTAGIVWTPDYIEGFSIAADFYDIVIDDAITFIGAQDVIDNCVDATGGPDASFCSQIDRNSTTNDIELVRSGYLNAAALETQGVEFTLAYRTDLNFVSLPGDLKVNLIGNKLLELQQFDFQDRPDEINVEKGEIGDPSLQLRLSAVYSYDDLDVSWTSRYIDRSARFDVSPGADIPEDISPAYVGSITTHDLSSAYKLNDTFSFNVGVRNLFDKTPPGYTGNALYDLVGRRVFAGVSVKF